MLPLPPRILALPRRLASSTAPPCRAHVHSATSLSQNVPEDRDESELRQLLEGFPGLVSVKLVRSRTSGASRGNAFVEFASEAEAAVLMETKAR